MTMKISKSLLMSAIALLSLSSAIEARDKKIKLPLKPAEDAITVVGHIPPTDGPVTRFMNTQHFSSHYLYVEHATGKNVTLIDVTKVANPVVLGDAAISPDGASGTLYVVAGTAALVTEGSPASPVAGVKTIRILNFADPQHPAVARSFEGVTATSRDERRGLIFVANGEGIWILHQRFAEDPELEKAYARQVVYQ